MIFAVGLAWLGSTLLRRTHSCVVLNLPSKEGGSAEDCGIVRGPWFIHKDVLLLQPWPPGRAVLTAGNCSVRGHFWIQAHGIPFGRMTAHNARIIAGRLSTGRSSKVDAFGGGLCLWPPVPVASRKVEILATTSASLVLGYVWLISTRRCGIMRRMGLPMEPKQKEIFMRFC